MPYYIDLKEIGLDEFQKKLVENELLPSRLILREKLAERFASFKKASIKNLFELQQLLKKKEKLVEFAKTSGLPEAYLTILIREINSLQPKPSNFKDFQHLFNDVILKLEKLGIKNTFQLFDKVITHKSRKELAKLAAISDDEILVLTKLSDLSRIRWVGNTFAWVLFSSGFDSVEKVANADYKNLYKTILEMNKDKKYYKGQIGLNDMKLLVNAAKELKLDIEY